VTQGDADYDAVRAELVWNGDIDRRPWAIARALSADDVAVAVKLARASGRELAVRGGGHNFSGSCIADGAIMIDLGALSAVSVTRSRKQPAAEAAPGGRSWTRPPRC
jgi:FAD/FMN-containing dehydrogenase